jgi:DNA-binding CsgD family transcriptional regulator
VNAATARPGVVVLESGLNVVACNAEALHILTFPGSPNDICDPNAWLSSRVVSSLVDRQASTPPGIVREFKSGQRTYLCSSFPINFRGSTREPNHPALALLLERKSNGGISIAAISARFALTPREGETVRLLLQGLTSKEIAQRMEISPNTVKAFLRLVMVKMGVSTRSGIIGKLL